MTPGRLPILLDLASEGLLLLDAQQKITGVNAAALTLLHRDLEALLGHDFWTVIPEAVAERHQKVGSRLAAAGHPYTCVAHHTAEDIWLQYTLRRHETGFSLQLMDVTASQLQKRQLELSERQNQIHFEANPNGMWLFDDDSFEILAANRAAIGFYGGTHKAFLELKMGMLFPDGDGASMLCAIDESELVGKVQFLHLCEQKKMDGQLVLVELAGGRIEWNGRPAVLISIADVSERHLADRNLRRDNVEMVEQVASLRGRLAHINRDLAAFTYGLSNDLQGPLHAVNGFAAMLAEKYAPVLAGSGMHYLTRIQAGTRQLARLVDDLRTLVQLPTMAATPDTIHLRLVCGKLMEDLRSRYPDRAATLEIVAAEPVTADAGLLTIALRCLLDNAWKFTSKKSESWIRLQLLPGRAPDERILQVSDNGTGFDPAYRDRLFTAFQRLHSSADFPGNGLGLAIVKKIAECHGGRVWAETSANGASFFMALPQGLTLTDGARAVNKIPAS